MKSSEHPLSNASATPALRVLPAASEVAAWVLAAREGDRSAMHALYAKHVHYMSGLCIRLLRDRELGLEVTQEAFVLAFERLSELREPAAFRGWLSQIAVRTARATMAQRRTDAPPSDAERKLAGALRVDTSAEARSELRAIQVALSRVPDDAAIAWSLRYLEDEPLDAVAAACGCSLATAKRWIDAADHEVRRTLGATP